MLRGSWRVSIDELIQSPPQSTLDVVDLVQEDRSLAQQAVAERAVPVLPEAELLRTDRVGWWTLSEGSGLGSALKGAREAYGDSFAVQADSLSLWVRREDRQPLAALRLHFGGELNAERAAQLLPFRDGACVRAEGSEVVLIATGDAAWAEELFERGLLWVPAPEDEAEGVNDMENEVENTEQPGGLFACPLHPSRY